MPFSALRSRPATSGSSHKLNNTSDDPQETPEISEHRPSGTFKPLSLKLSSSIEDSFGRYFSQEPEEIESRRQSEQKKRAPSTSEQKSFSTPAALSRVAAASDDVKNEDSNPDEESSSRPPRFSLLRFRHASDPQLSTRFKSAEPAVAEPPPPAPTIITTAPTSNALDEPVKRKSIKRVFGRSGSPSRRNQMQRQTVVGLLTGRNDGDENSGDFATSKESLRHTRLSTDSRRRSRLQSAEPPAYGDESTSQLAIPIDRLSDSSKSDGSVDHRLYAQTTTTHTISTTTTFFKLKRKKKDKGPLFPLPERLPRPSSGRTSFSMTPRVSTGRKSISPSRRSNTIRFDSDVAGPHSPAGSMLALTNAPLGTPGPSVVRKESTLSTGSGHSTPSVTLLPPRLGARGRSSTLGSLGRSAEQLAEALPPQPGSTRTSTSTSGRRSFGDLLSLPHRLRQNSAPPARQGSGNSPSTPISKPNSFQIPRETEPELIYPKREDGDTPASYLEKLEAAVPRGVMATILCKTADEFSKTCLRKYMRGFSYFGESIDMAIRKMLMEVELPKETQQIDRLLAGFADRYYECNPGIFASTDEASFVAFSILLLHSDTHNKNNKRKMQKSDYVKNTQQGSIQVSSDILDCFYDNICYTPFIHFDDEIAIASHRLSVPRPRKSLIKTKSNESLRGPVDPYSLILDNKLELLRPSLKDVMDTEDSYKSTTTDSSFDVNEAHTSFNRSGILQIISARSRPDAFSTQATISNPAEAQAGLVSIKIAKVGFLWRKDTKKKKAKSPWREWGAMLTDSKLYFFKDVSWVKKLVSQHEAHKQGGKWSTLIFKPPLTNFEPDAFISMDDAVALLDSSYKKHKYAFTLIKHGGFEEVFLANTDHDMLDWIGKLNYAAAFRTAGVRMRGRLGTNYEGRKILRKNSQVSTKSTESLFKESTSTSTHQKADPHALWEIMFYRRQLISEKVSDFEERIAAAQKELDNLLRNARHLQILLPVHAKSREALILAAGRMSAKLKWTRVELWRTRTHRDILVKDLEQEGSIQFPAPKALATATPQKTTPIKTGLGLGRTNTDSSRMTLSPRSMSSATSQLNSQTILERLHTPEDDKPEEVPLPGSPLLGTDASETYALAHKGSNVDSKDLPERIVTSTDDPEEQILREAGIITLDGSIKEKVVENSESEKDRLGAIPTPDHLREKGNIRRSLQRSLRESPHIHHSPTHLRHKKAKDSGSSLGIVEDGRSVSGESDELKRGTGSFILHGKKASVVTMSREWQALSTEEKLKLREKKGEEEHRENDDIIEDGTASNLSRPSSGIPDVLVPRRNQQGMEDERSSPTSGPKLWAYHLATDYEDEFVDARPTLEGTA